MISQVARWGNSLALRIPSPVAREVEIREGVSVDLVIRDGHLVVTPISDAPTYDLAELLSGLTEENIHGETNTGSAVGNEFA